ncbi:MAG: hypothetical protein EXS63_01940 [Candidatus Omnitrophica bacterium]|nr:hypothetical protein [Candidatus Omnitrophota bacterium]
MRCRWFFQRMVTVRVFRLMIGSGLLGIFFTPYLWADNSSPTSPRSSSPSSSASSSDPAAESAQRDAVSASVVNNSDDPNSITLDFKDADINTVLRVLSLKSRVNIVAGPEVQGTVTIRLENVAWEKALEVVLRTYNYVYERNDNIIRVTTREKMSQEPVVTQTYILNYTRAVEVQDSVKDMLTERGRIRIAERTNALIVTDIPTNLYRLQEVIRKLDQRTAQAFIDSKIVNTNFTVAENLGVQWNPAMSLAGSSRPTTFPFFLRSKDDREAIPDVIKSFFPFNPAPTDHGTAVSLTSATLNNSDIRTFPAPGLTATAAYTYGTLSFTDFSAALQALKSRSDTKVVSNPRIVVLNNQKAKVQVGKQIPLPNYERNETTGSVEVTGFNYRDVGVVMNVTPHINSEEEILVELAPEVSSVGETIDFGEFQMPSFNITQANTQVLIRSGETIAIGGLLTDTSQTNQVSVPFLGDIPIIGKLFRSKRQTSGSGNGKVETLFFITVTMVDTEGQPMGHRLEERKQRKQGGHAAANAPRALQVGAEEMNVGGSKQEAENSVVMDPMGPTQKTLVTGSVKAA